MLYHGQDSPKAHCQQVSCHTVKGHIKQERKNLQSTKASVLKDALDEDFFPPSDTPNLKTNDTVYAMVDPSKMGSASMDLTGRFPYTSRRGNQYVLVGYHYDANYIAAIPLKRRTGTEITNGWK